MVIGGGPHHAWLKVIIFVIVVIFVLIFLFAVIFVVVIMYLVYLIVITLILVFNNMMQRCTAGSIQNRGRGKFLPAVCAI